MELYEEFAFEAAHHLPNVPEGHKCHRMHGHSYRVRVHLEGEVGARSGWVIDFAEVREATGAVHQQLDHRVLNDIPGLDNPTAEVLAMWIHDRLMPVLPDLAAVEVKESPTAGVIYRAR